MASASVSCGFAEVKLLKSRHIPEVNYLVGPGMIIGVFDLRKWDGMSYVRVPFLVSATCNVPWILPPRSYSYS